MLAAKGISEELQKTGTETISIHTETFVPKPGFETLMRKIVMEKYQGVPIKAIMATLPPLAKAAAELRDELWPGIPLVYGVGETPFAAPANSTGVTTASDLRGTITAAFHLFPEARRLVIAGGSSITDQALRQTATNTAKKIRPGIDVIDLGGLPAAAMRDRIAATEPDSIILLTAINMVGGLQEVTDTQLVNLFAPVAKAPMFSIADYSQGSGVVGGSMSSMATGGSEAGKMLIRVLHGEPAGSIAPVRIAPKLVLDWRQLQRFRVPAERIPETAQILYRQPTLWRGHRNLILGTLLVGLAQALLILILFAERRRRRISQRRLAERLRYERLVSEISAGFTSVPAKRAEQRIEASLRRVAEFLEVERATIWWRESGGQTFESLQAWSAPQAPCPLPPGTLMPTELAQPLLAGRATCVADTASLDEDCPIRKALERVDVRSLLMIPLSTGGLAIGVLSCATLTRTHTWDPAQVENIQTLGELFANVLALRESEQIVRERDALNEAVLASLPGYVAILDRAGMILKLNDLWLRITAAADYGLLAVRTGENYLAHCREAAKDNAALSHVADLVSSALRGERQNPIAEINQTLASGEQWLEIRLEPLMEWAGGAVITFLDITARKRAELHAARNLETISHMNRVSAVSELASSLAHELNQPLSAIGFNAQAGVMELALPDPNRVELGEILKEILSDNQRAGDVIRHMRELLKRRDRVTEQMEVNDIARRVVPLVRNEASLRHAHFQLDLAVISYRLWPRTACSFNKWSSTWSRTPWKP